MSACGLRQLRFVLPAGCLHGVGSNAQFSKPDTIPPHCALCYTGLQTARHRFAGLCLFLERRGMCEVEIDGIDTLSNALVNDIRETMCKNGAPFRMTAPMPLLKVWVHPSRKAACRISGRIYL